MIRRWAVILAVIVLAACQPPVRLMPTPAVFATGEHNPFSVNSSLETTNQVEVFYATNRLPIGPRGSRVYTILPGQSLYLGTARVRIGPREKNWESLYPLSTNPSTGSRSVLRLETLDEEVKIRGNEAPASITPEARRFFDAVDAALARSLDKDLTIYVHGANSNIEVAVAQAAQYRHFTGRNSVVLAFAWPSAESGLRYFTDVQNARLSVPVFARLIDLLIRHTAAAHINLLAYSAGSQVVSPALAALRGLRQDGGPDIRLGEVYFAAPDIAFPAFAAQLPHYVDRVRRVTVSVNLNDAVLRISQFFQGVSRLGRPDPTELSEEDSRWLIEASRRLSFDLISVDPGTVPGLGRRSHSFWYDHPWVSSDVMIKLLFHIPPAARGLEPNWTERRFRYWTFPSDYDRRVVKIMRRLRSERLESAAGRSVGGDGVAPLRPESSIRPSVLRHFREVDEFSPRCSDGNGAVNWPLMLLPGSCRVDRRHERAREQGTSCLGRKTAAPAPSQIVAAPGKLEADSAPSFRTAPAVGWSPPQRPVGGITPAKCEVFPITVCPNFRQTLQPFLWT